MNNDVHTVFTTMYYCNYNEDDWTRTDLLTSLQLGISQTLQITNSLYIIFSSCARKTLTRNDRPKTRGMQLLAFPKCIWHCIHAQDAMKHTKYTISISITPLLLAHCTAYIILYQYISS